MAQSIALLGRQPAMGLAELESLYGAEKLTRISEQAALLDIDSGDIAFSRLGGTIKLARLLTILDTIEWSAIAKHLQERVIEHAQYLPEGKMSIGLSVYGLSVKPNRINATGLELKKLIKSSGRPVRVVPNKTPELSSAQVLHNNLTGERAWELLFIRGKDKTYVAQTTNVQDIDAYAARDQARPKRDAKVGMLPPKLAQIIINLAVGQPTANSQQPTVLDPFCGTGVVLQEALLMGYDSYGTDLEPRMVEYSQANLEWLFKSYVPRLAVRSSSLLPSINFSLELGDATNQQWKHFDNIACETYLGRPFSALPKPEILREVMSDVDAILKKFLQNVARQTKTGFKMCVAVPAWKTKFGFAHLKVLDNLGDLGYTRAVFTHVDSAELIYHRPEQIVARELVVLIRK